MRSALVLARLTCPDGLTAYVRIGPVEYLGFFHDLQTSARFPFRQPDRAIVRRCA
jgi:hypothetical protein